MDANIHPLLQHAAEVTHGQEHADAVPDVDREQLDEYRPPTQIADRRLEGTDVELHDGASIMVRVINNRIDPKRGLSPLGWWEFGDGAEVGGDVQAVSVPVLGWAIA
ncbi:hypothetical protein MTY66_53840 [Mycolicibacterium sp. TY66]|uniref:hypothetical protein n=1 Tax=unclassified Mycolicibacterium TaxID=2636767 RepID=UPI001BB32277|nr:MULTISPECIES: hypothetical protein [unclassified Mycolicibacterium]BCI83759.1 hypothetical protein MTY66_53840 [Mycolicibacterium sp. TY66]BCJ84622.1 hypothetical protein MTY81_59950 [Mycolicibacterium sp. TY81]